MQYNLHSNRIAFVVSIVMVTAFLSFGATVGFRAHYRRQALIKIEQNGGWVAYLHEQEPQTLGMGGKHRTVQSPPGPWLLRRILGDAFFVRVVAIDYTFREVSGDPASDSLDLAPLQAFPEIDSLDLEACNVTDKDLWRLPTLKRLERLYLGWNPITDRGLVHLGKLTALKELDLQHTHVTDDGLRHLGLLHGLERCVLNHTAVSDDGLRFLSNASNLQKIDLWGTDVTGTAFATLPRSLTHIDMSYSGATDSTLASVSQLTSLETISLRGTRVTDEVHRILNSQKLSQIDLRWTFVTEQGARELRRQHPEASVTIGPRVPDEDVAQIKELIGKTKGIDKRILGFSRIDENQVEVWTGFNRATLNGKGDIITVRKEDGSWIVVGVCGWLS